MLGLESHVRAGTTAPYFVEVIVRSKTLAEDTTVSRYPYA